MLLISSQNDIAHDYLLAVGCLTALQQADQTLALKKTAGIVQYAAWNLNTFPAHKPSFCFHIVSKLLLWCGLLTGYEWHVCRLSWSQC